MSTHTEGHLTASDGLRIFHQAWLPDGPPTAAVMLIHGLGEHSGRYGDLAESLVALGYAVHALDHRGHGRSEGKRAFVRSYDELLGDLAMFRRHIEAEHPGLPLVVLGHSMGGNLAVGHALEHQDGIAALVLSGPALQIGADLTPFKIKVFSAIARVVPGFRPQALSAEAISRDPAVVAAYQADPLVFTGKISAGLGAALIGAMERFPDRYAELRLPILLLHGTGDQLADVEGTRTLERLATNAAVTAHYYEGLYHEVFNEPEREQVLADLHTWLTATLARA